MCRNIKTLRRPAGPPTEEELQAAALQFVRKVTGYRSPSRANREAFERAVTQIAAATHDLFEDLVLPSSMPASRGRGVQHSPAVAENGRTQDEAG